MNRCTVCGATSREGAKFCTSCGARLGEDVVQAPAPSSFATDKDAGRAAPSTSTDTSEQAAITTSDAPNDTKAEDADPVQKEDSGVVEPRDSTGSEADGQRYTSSWPEADTASGDQESLATAAPQDRATTDADQDEASPPVPDADTGWPDEPDADEEDDNAPVTAPPPASFATDADQDPASPRTRPEADSADWPEPSNFDDDEDTSVTAPAPTSFATDADQDPRSREMAGASADADHQGASGWEGWAPVASAPVSASGVIDEHFARLHELLDEMQRRIERVRNPASLASRDLDPDDLADQLERWSRTVPDSDDLLESVKQLRRSPRDIDAMMRLADRAPDLELLVRHYQSITSTSDQWAADLRHTREDAPSS